MSPSPIVFLGSSGSCMARAATRSEALLAQRDVRRMLARRSKELLGSYRRGEPSTPRLAARHGRCHRTEAESGGTSACGRRRVTSTDESEMPLRAWISCGQRWSRSPACRWIA